MTSVSSSNKGRSLFLSPENVIRLTTDNATIVEKLLDNEEQTYKLFGEIEVERLLTLCYLSLGIQDIEGKVVGAMCLQPYPNIKALPTNEWNHWIETKYGITDAICMNTLWIHLAVSNPVYYMLFFNPMLHYLFKSKNDLKYVIMIVPPGNQNLDFTLNLGVTVISPGCVKDESPYLILFRRSTFSILYKIRKAVEEDNDDLVPLIESYSPRFRELYGDYYIAEILMNGKEMGRQLIVAEYQGAAVAVLCVNSTVNYQVLNEEFELVPFNGLKKPHPEDYADLNLEATLVGEKPSRQLKTIEEDILDIIEKKSVTESTKIEEEEEIIEISRSDSDEFSLVFTSASLFVFQDDDDEASVTKSQDMGKRDSVETAEILSQYKMQEDEDKQGLEEAEKHADWISAYMTIKGFYEKIPEFKGASNAFALEIAASLQNHEQGIIELFDASFDCFPDRDYCVMVVPHTVPVNKLVRHFGRVPPRSISNFPFELYIMHRNSSLANIEVEEATKHHQKAVKNLLSTIPNNSIIIEQFEDSVNVINSPYSSIVALCENQIFGLAIVSEETDFEYLKAHYDLSALNLKMYRSGNQGVLENLVFSPIFQTHDKFFLREIHRLTDYDVLYYRHTPYDSSESFRERPLMNLTMDLLPIMPILQPQYDMDILKAEDCYPSETVVEKRDPFALYVSTLPLSSLGKNVVNTKILVIGCSHTALSFLQALVLKQTPNFMMSFNNVTLLCANGLAHKRITPRIREVFLLKKNFWDSRYMDSVSLKTYVNVVHGKITKLDRKEQYVIVNGSSFIDYDLLFLMCGEQFQRPVRPDRIPFVEDPLNALIVNNSLDANNAIIILKHLYHQYDDKNYVIIVYGHFLQAHTAIHGLINYGIPGSHLVLVEPFPYSIALEKRERHNVSIYNDPTIDEAVYENIQKEGVKIYSSYYFIDWTYNPINNLITKVKFESKHKMLEIECMAIFFFNEKEISPRIYRVIDSAALVYDGRLVINAKCQTNDPNIYGAGTLTKYSRKYYAPHMLHKYYNRIEIGKRLGCQIREMLIQQKARKRQQETGWNFSIERGELLVPRYFDPIMRYCRLPGGLHYLSVVKPGKRIPMESAVCMENFGQILITGNCKDLSKQGYFQLHLNEFNRVETITCLHTQPIDVYNIHCLWGKHEKLLNNLGLRFEMAMISDLYGFFKEPWAYAIYHEKFANLMDELNMLMTSGTGNSGDSTLINILIDLYKQSRWKRLSKNSTELLEDQFVLLGYPKIIENKVLNFIKDQLHHLPMYAHPIVIRQILRNYNESPLFSD